MKKVISLTVVLMVVLSLACPAFAAEDTFVPSISYKGAPEIVADSEGNIGVVLDEDGKILDYLQEGCLLITSVAEAESSAEIPSAAKDLLLSVYNQLNSGAMVLPTEKLDSKLEPDEVVIRDLVDISWMCDEHHEMVEPKGIVFQITLNLHVDADTEVHVMTYKNNAWNPIVDVVNNGDGTITCTFEDLCPVAFAVGEDVDVPTTGHGISNELIVWMSVLAVSVAALVVMVAFRRKAIAE